MYAVINQFKSRHEVYFPLVLGILGLAYVTIFGFQVTGPISYIATAIVLTLFFNTTHIGFTFSTVWCLPEAHKWIELRFGNKNLFFLLLFTVSIFFIFALLISFHFFSNNPNINSEAASSVMKVIAAASIWHNMAQSMGLSLAYNYKLKQSGLFESASADRIDSIAKIERRNAKIVYLFLVFFLFGGCDQLAKLLAISTLSIKILLFCVSQLIIFQILYLVKKSKEFGETDKFLFCMRYLIWPLTGFIRVGVYIFQAIHGFEYLFLNNKMGKNSSLVKNNRNHYKRVVFFFGALFFIFGVFEMDSIGSLMITEYNFNQRPIILVTSMSTGLFLVHLLWDRYFFRLRDQVGLKTAGKLILGTSSSEE